ncbi:MAG: acyl-CoA dehydrogenase family protein [Candidatus Sumerlaeia bacterium]|nr:acyl-CoA dehydrogenase family protein [Candidatus Sumerlaeia bacterium]
MNSTATLPRGSAFLFQPADPAAMAAPEAVPQEAREFQRTVRAFIVDEVQPRFDAIDSDQGALVPELLKGLAGLGLFMAEIPEELDGLGLGLTEVLPTLEELGRASSLGVAAMVHQGIGMQPLVFAGSDALAGRWVAPLMSAEILAAYALTEPGYGSDALAGISTAAHDAAARQWVLNGSKQFITNGRWAEVFQVFAQVEGKGLSAFMVERGAPGFEVLAEEHKMGIKGSSTCALRFAGVRVAEEAVLGELGRGHKLALNMLNLGRLKLGTTMIGAMKELLRHCWRYGSERRQFGTRIIDFGMLRQKVAEMGALAFGAEALAARVGGEIDRLTMELREAGQGRAAKLAAADEFSVECSIAKFWMTEAANVCADHAVQLFGGYGFSEEYPVARYYRDLRVARLYEGTNEINRLNTVNAFLRRVKGPHAAFWAEAMGAAREAAPTDACAAARRFLAAAHHALIEASNGSPKPSQPVTAGLAEIAAELLVAETARLRANALAHHPEGALADRFASILEGRLAAALLRNGLAVEGELGLGELDRLLPAAAGALAPRFAQELGAAELLLAHEGEWPAFADR